MSSSLNRSSLGHPLYGVGREVIAEILSRYLGLILSLLCCLVSTNPGYAQEKLPFVVPKDLNQLPDSALIETTKGAFEVQFLRQDAPLTVANFEYLARKGFYNNVGFRRYIPGYIIQGGDPSGTGKGGPGYTLPPEFSSAKHRRGMMGMSRHPNEVNSQRRSNGSQFYITLGDAPNLDGFYTLFARVANGMDVVEKLRPEDKILTIRFPRRDSDTITTP